MYDSDPSATNHRAPILDDGVGSIRFHAHDIARLAAAALCRDPHRGRAPTEPRNCSRRRPRSRPHRRASAAQGCERAGETHINLRLSHCRLTTDQCWRALGRAATPRLSLSGCRPLAGTVRWQGAQRSRGARGHEAPGHGRDGGHAFAEGALSGRHSWHHRRPEDPSIPRTMMWRAMHLTTSSISQIFVPVLDGVRSRYSQPPGCLDGIVGMIAPSI